MHVHVIFSFFFIIYSMIIPTLQKKNVKAWLEVVVNANNDVIAIFEKLDVIGVLLLEIEKDDLINDADMKVDDVSEREKLWKEIYKLRRAEGALNDSSDYDDDF